MRVIIIFNQYGFSSKGSKKELVTQKRIPTIKHVILWYVNHLRGQWLKLNLLIYFIIRSVAVEQYEKVCSSLILPVGAMLSFRVGFWTFSDAKRIFWELNSYIEWSAR